ncbi:Protein of unknown function (DUF1275) [Geosmithia morbida]|uniref:DUF1275 domain protein n=1 Tax=Geosmithia morbida TaxID=1094350 RepID=A0A9P5D6Q3_9HYPO|nr:Protein of unknown function (DUF1275) [Geosmithia morbida]KAF4125000.1 Protein of unknown function (DUF1275) [Geosmithia morbida]
MASTRDGIVTDEEQQPLLRQHSPPGRTVLSRLGRSMHAEVDRSWADLVLLLCYFVTGLLDSSSTQVWGAFVSMQTGNSVYVGLGLASLAHPPASSRLWRSGVSLVSFCAGSFIFARFHRHFSPKRRWVLCASFAAQALLTTAAASVVGRTSPAQDPDSTAWNVLLPIGLVAFQSCAQAVTSRALRYNALTSVVLTSIYCDLFSDKDLLAPVNAERNRRAAAPVLLIGGAVVGGLLAHSAVGIGGALWLAALLKLLMVVLWIFWPAEKEE